MFRAKTSHFFFFISQFLVELSISICSVTTECIIKTYCTSLCAKQTKFDSNRQPDGLCAVSCTFSRFQYFCSALPLQINQESAKARKRERQEETKAQAEEMGMAETKSECKTKEEKRRGSKPRTTEEDGTHGGVNDGNGGEHEADEDDKRGKGDRETKGTSCGGSGMGTRNNKGRQTAAGTSTQ